jgi:hypothetical protein
MVPRSEIAEDRHDLLQRSRRLGGTGGIRDGHYWTTWPAVAPNWYQVPDEVVIKDPNKVGHPVVWVYYERGEVRIRCYIPGGKV